MFIATNAWETNHIQTNDYKVDNIVCGIQGHACTFSCYLCKASKDRFLDTWTPTRTLKSLFEDYDAYTYWCSGKTKKEIEEGAKLFFNVTKETICAKQDEEDLDIPTRKRVAMDELHTMTGSFDKLYK